MKKYIMECIGTMFLVISMILIANPIAIGAMFVGLVYIGAHVSGGYYNPAITLALWLRGTLKSKVIIGYMFAQLFGAFLGVGFYFWMSGKKYLIMPTVGLVWWKWFALELLLTLFLCLVVLAVTTGKKVKNNNVYGLIIGFALLAIAFVGGKYNPAISLAPALFDACFWSFVSIVYVPTHFFASFLGGALSFYVYKYLNIDELKK